MPRVSFDSFAVEVPAGWADITDTVAADNTPYPLAHYDGVGALQISIGLYKGGRLPDPSPIDLREMVEQFGQARGLGEPAQIVTEAGPPALAAGSFAWGERFLRVWQLSDGRNFALVTYLCATEDAGYELAACEVIVRSLVFTTTPREPA